MQLALLIALAAALAGELELQVVQALLGLAERFPLLAEGLGLSPPQLEGGVQLPLGRQRRALLLVNLLEAKPNGLQLLHGRFQARLALQGLPQLALGFLDPLLGLGQGAAGLHLAGGGEQAIEVLLNPLVNEAIEGGFQGGRWSLLLELLHQPLQVVGRARPAEQVAAGLPLAHPEMGPALGELANASAFDGPVHPEQGR